MFLRLSAIIPIFKNNKALVAILGATFLLRVVGLDYGLPLWLVGDEVSHIFGALKMMELKTVLPVLHDADFAGVMYYTPHLSYLYLIPFTFIAGVKYFALGGDLSSLKNILAADPSAFFIVARSISVLFGLVTVWLVYKAAKELFNKRTGLFAALFLGLSFLHISYSHWARHWTPVTFFFVLGIYILAHQTLSVSKKYLLMALVIGIGVGFNVQVLILGLYTIIWFLIFDRISVLNLLRQSWLYKAILIFVGLFAAGFALWPRGYSYLLLIGSAAPDKVSERSLAGFIEFYWFYLNNLIRAEPVFLLFILIGVATLFFIKRKLSIMLGGFSLVYIALFYFFFSHVDRFILVLYPIFAILAGFGLSFLTASANFAKLKTFLIVVVVVLLAAPAMRYSYLLYKNDTRVQAINWIKQNVPVNSKVVVLAPLTRITSNATAVEELENIDPNILRSVDKADALNNSANAYHALNLFNVPKERFETDVGDYLTDQNYEYLIYNSDLATEKGFEINLEEHEVKFVFDGYKGKLNPFGRERLPDGFGDGLNDIFHSKNLGPEIVIYKLK